MIKKDIDNLKLEGLQEGAFRHKLKEQEHPVFRKEIVTQSWYKLSMEEAIQFIEKKRADRLPDTTKVPHSWIKLVVNKAKHIETGEIRYWWATSLRPYIQGYGCDGITDINIHIIANRLAIQYNIDYPKLMLEVYPKVILPTGDFSWLEDEVSIAETFIPSQIDPILVLDDLMQINNYSLAERLAILLENIGIVSDNWCVSDNISRFNEHIIKAQAAYLSTINNSI